MSSTGPRIRVHPTLLPPRNACVTAVTKVCFYFFGGVRFGLGDLLRRFDRAHMDNRQFSLAKMRQHLALGSQSATRLSERQSFLRRVRWLRDITLREGRSVSPLAE